MKEFKPTQEQLDIFNRNFDVEAFDKMKGSVQKAVKESACINELMRQLRAIKDVQCVEFADDDDLENEDFVPGYKGVEDDSCDFLVILCYAELDRSKMETGSRYVEVCFYIVYNDVKQKGWLDDASLATADNPEDYAEKICFFDFDTHEPIAWCRDLEKDND